MVTRIPRSRSSSTTSTIHSHINSQLAVLEAAEDIESVTLSSLTSKNIKDCQTFLFQHVPHDVLYVYAYDVVSMLHLLCC